MVHLILKRRDTTYLILFNTVKILVLFLFFIYQKNYIGGMYDGKNVYEDDDDDVYGKNDV